MPGRVEQKSTYMCLLSGMDLGVHQPMVAFGLAISFCEPHLISRHQHFSQPNILQPVPKAEVVVEYVMVASWVLCFGGIS